MSKRLRSIDLNLVPILRALLTEQSVTRAAHRIGLSQPATSSALARLRGHLGDALLVKSGRSMVCTPLGAELLPALDATCAELERLLLFEIWSPATVHRNFVIVMTDFLMLSIAGDLQAILAEQAPSVTVRFGAIGPALPGELSSGSIDMAYLGYSTVLAHGLNLETIARHPLEGIVSSSHPFASRPPQTYLEFANQERIGLRIPGALLKPDQSTLSELMGSWSAQMEFSTTHLSLLPALADVTNSMAIVPKPIAVNAVRERRMVSVEIPEKVIQYELCKYWSHRFDTDPGHRWLRAVMDDLIKSSSYA
ncbi:LysR family transcriptional regulator [Sphingomonas sp. PP-CC-3G-468]|uniref:LysR family transcriptional regulator n=1 Tax=Sphingomonas sp. PP-CC-3G-468 TaxID=2135656 RepID=UPI00104C7372|nr:LysR family transcriptional regulator [Sphingomonas sp. PP-CC-3G-468]